MGLASGAPALSFSKIARLTVQAHARPAESNGVSLSVPDRPELRAGMSAVLQQARNADGGWAYHSGKRSRIEPTCWALLALSQGGTPNLEPLRQWPRSENWLIDIPGAPPNHAFNAIAALTLLQSASTSAAAETIVRLLIASKGMTFGPDSPAVARQDNSLEAWSWVDGTASWVEPTAWSVLVLKQRLARGRYPDAAERVRLGEEMLSDRACRGGGWNYGNPNVYGKDLMPYVPTTALALLALQNRRDEPAVVRGLQQLQRDVLSERSTVALSLAIICLRAYELPAIAPEQYLTQLIADRHSPPGWNDDLLGLAMALYALSDGPLAAFTLGAA